MRLSCSQVLGAVPGRGVAVLGALVFLFATFTPVEAQYFGRNKVQYDDFDFEVLTTDHFHIHYYPEAGVVIEDVSRMAERWYERYARLFQHEFERAKPLVLYADHPDFQQTNTLQGQLGESTGGVTESLKNRVIMPMTGSYQDTDHVLGHELVHAFQYNLAQSRQGSGIPGLARLPGWLVEGMAEYLSVGRDDPLTAMWVRDAVLRDDLPTIRQMTQEVRYFPYRFGQALWAYIGGRYGDEAVVELFRSSLRAGWEPSLNHILGIDSDTLSAQWAATVREEYIPLMKDRDEPGEVGTLLLAPSVGSGSQNLAPSLSPDGELLVYMSEKDLFSIDLFLADADDGETMETLSRASADPHFDALRFVDSSGSWSPDGSRLAFIVFADGDNQLIISDSDDGSVQERVAVEGIGAMQGPAWSPDGNRLAFSGTKGGISDIFLYDLQAETTTQLTADRNADFQPVFSPDGTTLAFVSDRSSTTSFERLTYARFQLVLMDLETGDMETLSIFGPDVKHINPQFSPDGEALYFISDVDGFSDIYRLRLASGQVERITRIATGVSGITWSSPAMSVASRTGEIAFSVFDEFEFHVYTLTPEEVEEGAEVVASADPGPGRNLPPIRSRVPSRVASYLEDWETGLEEPGAFAVEDAEEYVSDLQLDFIGQPTLGVGTDPYGNYLAGGTSAFFSDMLGDRMMAVAVSAQGTVKDIGGQLIYLDQGDRWNWGYGLGRIPYQFLFYSFGEEELNGRTLPTIDLVRQRIFLTQASGLLSYPFSRTRRLEGSFGFTRYSYDLEMDRTIYNEMGLPVARKRVQLDEFEPDPLNLFQGSIAFVGDYSFFGFTSPVRGGRYRFEVEVTEGSASYQTITADYRRYFNPALFMTLAFRGLHYGRYNYDEAIAGNQFIRPLFLGYETFIRGYAWESFEQRECGASDSCPVFERLFGQRLAVANVEVRIPFLGTEQFGLLDLPYLPMEIVAFTDVGIAWDDENPVDSWSFSTSSTKRVPLVSSGISGRFNILGFMVLEAYYAYPWQRPDKGAHWGFQLAPGW